jgi:acyl-CoA thioester hydrolase
MTDAPTLAAYPLHSRDKLRYGDTDRQGHINNAVFATFFETGRVEVIYNAGAPLTDPGCSFVLARLLINYRAELNWPGEVTIGSRIIGVGRSSIQLEQAIFCSETCVASGETTIVHFDQTTRKSRPLSEVGLKRAHDIMALANR